MTGIIGKKIGMTRLFSDNGDSHAVTILEAGPCVITQIKTEAKDGYYAMQVGFVDLADKRLNKPSRGHFNKSGSTPKRHLVEFPTLSHSTQPKLGDEVTVSIFGVGDRVTVKGVSKGKGFSGVVKRHGFGGGRKTHGQSDRLRAPGSIGQASDPSRVWLGTKMAGQYGNKTAVVKNLQVIRIDPDNHYLFLKGSVPGARASLVMVIK